MTSLVFSCLLSCVVGAGETSHVDFERAVYPLLRRACWECHGVERQEAELRLDQRASALSSGSIVPGSPDESELVRRISLPRGHDEVMPARGATLSKGEIATIRAWIEQGAAWPDNLQVGLHWSYIAPVGPVLPQVQDVTWPQKEIDYFVLQRLENEDIKPSPAAQPETLVRRVFLDLIGLPPSPADVDAFLADPSEAAYRQLIDELLKRPQFGERWARPWLDLARYADSHGFQRDDLRDIWAYRDWVIRALNADMPFDQFTIEQIAGDLLPDATESQKIATGFHRCTPTNVEAGSIPEATRIDQVIDRVNTTSTVWLGTTLECAQCHDHKYDPFKQKDYYRLLAFFNNTELEADRARPNVPSSIAFQGPSMPIADADRDSQRKALEAQIADARRQQSQRHKQLEQGLDEWAAALAARQQDAPVSHVLEVVGFASTGTTDSHRVLEDGSVLLVGDDPPDRDTYMVHVRTDLANIRALRLDALTHSSLPGSGPGRGDAKRSNFVLNSFSVTLLGDAVSRGSGADGEAADRSGKAEAIRFKSASADFSQAKWDAAGAIDADPKSGWAIAPQFGAPHWAIFELAEPLDASDGLELMIRLEQNLGGARTIGRLRLSAVTGDLGCKSLPAQIARLVERPVSDLTAQERNRLIEHRAGEDDRMIALSRKLTGLHRDLNDLQPFTTLVMQELEKPRRSAIFQRGDYRQQREPVTPGVPEVLHPLPDGPPNRLTLARWLVDPANPLVGRVTVNRWWAEIFGRGIVPTVEDFGVKGDSPSHPELLDWLAVEFMQRGWSMKHMLRTIVLSATYRQSSRVTPERLAADERNELLARGPRLRMDAEMIRDNALAISGLLSLSQFGPPIRPYQPDGIWTKVGGQAYDYVVSPGDEKCRRGLYVVIKRGAPYPSFINFDGSARLACTVKRSRTNTPLQALTLLNDPVYVEAAFALARRVVTERQNDSVDNRIKYAFRLCTARCPDDFEQRTLRELLDRQLGASRQDPQSARTLLGDFVPPNHVSAPEFAAWYSLATTLMNLHETITKE